MQAYKTVFLLASIIQVILCQHKGPPSLECRQPPPEAGSERIYTCCMTTPLITDENLAACGFTFEDEPHKKQQEEREDCALEECVAREIKVTKEDGVSLDPESISAFLDKWAENNPGFEKALEIAKKNCFHQDVPGPPGTCMFNKVSLCFSNILTNYCPKWKETETCRKVKKYWDECQEYFPSYE